MEDKSCKQKRSRNHWSSTNQLNANKLLTDQLMNTDHLIYYSLIRWETIHWSTDDQLITGDQLFSYQPMIGGRKSLKKSGEAAVGRRDQFKLLGKTFDQICEIQTSPSPQPPSPLVYGMPYMSSCAWLLLCFLATLVALHFTLVSKSVSQWVSES